jgi:hypothetical protein
MFNFRIIIVSIFTLLLISCSNEPNNDKATGNRLAFNKFLANFKILSLPLNIMPGRMSVDQYKKINSTDKYFTGYKENETLYAFGMLPDTSGCFKVIWLEPADDYYPVLATFSKNGKKIKQEDIGVGGCGVDCGFECTETVTIRRDMSIYSVDSIKSTPCDSNGDANKKAAERYIRYKTGKIMRRGNIRMSADLKKNIN